MCLVSMIANIKHVGLDPLDTLIIAVDSPHGNWRKELDPAYKANRKAAREKSDIDWSSMFSQFQLLLENLEAYTPFHSIIVERMEADDIIAYGCKKFQGRENIILSADSDYEQLYAYPKTKMFSPISKRYKEVKNPYRIILNKIRKETADNLISPILTEEDYKLREKLVNLIELPKEVEETIDPFLEDLHEKDWDYDKIYFRTLVPRLKTIYDKDKVISMAAQPKRKKAKGTKKLDL